MRISTLLTAPLLGLLAAIPAQAPAQVNVQVSFGARLGPEVRVFGYSPDQFGDWHASYRQWTPVTLYDVNGHYYRHTVSGARAVVVYSRGDEFFFPPEDRAWIGFDKRYDYVHQPIAIDRGRAHPFVPHVEIDRRLGAEIGVVGFSAERAGDWRKNYRRWTPVTVYEMNGRYYPHAAPGARAVAVYSYHDEYFLPPDDREFNGFDKRFDYHHMPNAEDRGRVHIFGRVGG